MNCVSGDIPAAGAASASCAATGPAIIKATMPSDAARPAVLAIPLISFSFYCEGIVLTALRPCRHAPLGQRAKGVPARHGAKATPQMLHCTVIAAQIMGR